MEEYYFLFAIAFLFTLFASIQDLKKREVANWLNFSLILFALGYRIFYSIVNKDQKFFFLGLFGFFIFFALAHLLYYAKAFAGGDAKLLMAFGVILPYENYLSLFLTSISFILVLFLIGAIYSIFYSLRIIAENPAKFKKSFNEQLKKNKILVISSLPLFVISIILSFFNFVFVAFIFLFIIPSAYVYTKALEKNMIKVYPPSKLTEGDWLERTVKVKGKTIEKTVHGVSLEDIKILKKYNKSVLIKEGIPFVPSFFFALILLIITNLILKIPIENIVFFQFANI